MQNMKSNMRKIAAGNCSGICKIKNANYAKYSKKYAKSELKHAYYAMYASKNAEYDD